METDLSHRQLVQIAGLIRDQLLGLGADGYSTVQRRIQDFIDAEERLQPITRGLAVCSTRRWHAAARRLTNEAERILGNLPYLQNRVTDDWLEDLEEMDRD